MNGIIAGLIVGVLAGFIASKLTDGAGKGCLVDLFLGVIGAHKFYAGLRGMGLLYLFAAGLFGRGKGRFSSGIFRRETVRSTLSLSP